jgi:branched-chain amino acid transport system permease protein
MIEALSAGYLSSSYKDAVAFLIILVVLVVMPQGLFGRVKVERV